MINAGVFGNNVSLNDRYIQSHEKLGQLVTYWKEMGLKIVLTSGTFDLPHIGHFNYLEKAKTMGDILIVGVDSDEKVKIRKGPSRPVVPQDERIAMLCHLRHVDVITIKNHSDPKLHLLKMVRPHILVLSETTGHEDGDIDYMKNFCGKVEIIEPQSITSTTAKVRLLFTEGVSSLASKIKKFVEEQLELAGKGGK